MALGQVVAAVVEGTMRWQVSVTISLSFLRLHQGHGGALPPGDAGPWRSQGANADGRRWRTLKFNICHQSHTVSKWLSLIWTLHISKLFSSHFSLYKYIYNTLNFCLLFLPRSPFLGDIFSWNLFTSSSTRKIGSTYGYYLFLNSCKYVIFVGWIIIIQL